MTIVCPFKARHFNLPNPSEWKNGTDNNSIEFFFSLTIRLIIFATIKEVSNFNITPFGFPVVPEV